MRHSAAEAFFDDPEYLRVVAAEKRPRESAAQARAAALLAGCGPHALVLDAGCGSGRHAHPLARAGHRVVGLDRSAVLLRAARRAAAVRGPRFVQGSYAVLPFPAGRFDAVLSLGSSLGYDGEEGDRAALREFRRVLAPGGRLVIETLHRGELGVRLGAHEERALPSGETLCFYRSLDPASGMLHEAQHLGAGATRAYDMRLYTEDEWRAMLEGEGFAVIATYGSLAADGPPGPTTPLVMVARAGRSSRQG
jgi:SAM-dependent methyltransferase